MKLKIWEFLIVPDWDDFGSGRPIKGREGVEKDMVVWYWDDAFRFRAYLMLDTLEPILSKNQLYSIDS